MKSEHAEQVTLVSRIRNFYPDVLVAAVPNGGLRVKTEAARLKAEGVLPGFPDLIIAEPRVGYHGLFVEMKRARGGRTSIVQLDVQEKLRRRGYRAVTCAGADEAWDVVEDYLALP